MADRDRLTTAFLATTDWADATPKPLAGDASNRRYLRLVRQTGETAVLMDAPPEKGEDVRPFVSVDETLRAMGLSAPKILASDKEHGFLLLEDLGDDLFARVITANSALETPLYEAATDTLLALHTYPAPQELAPYSTAIMSEMAALSYRWYLRGLDLPYEDQAEAFQGEIEPILKRLAPETDVLIQRDYHAENLLWLPDRNGVARVGLLDFQDAMAGHRAYDLVSLLQDARRDVPKAIEAAMLDRYIAASGQDRARFLAAYHLLGAQRNLRIIGVFARLSMHFGKPHYVDFLPRVWSYLERDLAHPALASLRDRIFQDLPAPTVAHLQKLKDKCATIPTL